MRFWRSFSGNDRALLLFFVLTLPFLRASVRGDGIGYYAFARSLLVDRDLQFAGDWKTPGTAPPFILRGREGRIASVSPLTPTGHVNNHFSIGPAILWAPFLATTHIGVLAANRLGWQIAADGFSRPYLVAMAAATAFYGFLGLWLSFHLARCYVEERLALLATIGIWLGSSLTAYIYAAPAWSHAHSAFAVALFLWYWERTRRARSWRQWVVLGLAGGLMMDVYYVNAIFLIFPALESLAACCYTPGARETRPIARLAAANAVLAAAAFLAFLPTLIVKKIIYGSYLDFGYNERWFWSSPAFFKVLFSPSHGLFPGTPILLLAVAGVILLRRVDRALALYSLAALLTFAYAIGCYEKWDGASSFGNRFFVSFTPIFVLGLSALFSEFARWYRNTGAAARRIAVVCALLVLWNLGLVFQWTTGLMPDVGPIYWSEVLYNQFRVVPGELLPALRSQLAPGQALAASAQTGKQSR